MNKIKIGAVSYLNTKPLLYGIKNSKIIDEIELIEDYPSKIAAMLIDGKIDVGLVPVVIMSQLTNSQIISNYCIGANNEVASVALFSNYEMEDIDTVILDFQSRSSVALVKVLFKRYWKKEVIYKNASENYIDEIDKNIGGVIIGDRALQYQHQFKFHYDLASAWRKYTNLPFVFAAWIANKELPKEFIEKFNEANKTGLENLSLVINENPCDYYDLNKYYTENISYNFDDQKKKGLELFLKLIKEL